jgi:hypothetical protein
LHQLLCYCLLPPPHRLLLVHPLLLLLLQLQVLRRIWPM